MSKPGEIRCRVAACKVDSDWQFHLINDSAERITSAVLTEVGYEWGDMGNSETPSQEVGGIEPGGHTLIWTDDGSGAEMRMDLRVMVRLGSAEVALLFEFPRLYRKANLPVVPEIGRPGWVVAPDSL